VTRPRLLLTSALVAIALMGQGCSPQFARLAAGAFIVTAAAVTVMAIHDAHMHSRHCGHHYVVVEQEPVYYYEGRWEFYDEESGRWYRYRDAPPQARYRRAPPPQLEEQYEVY
jgi:hypothetical protein